MIATIHIDMPIAGRPDPGEITVLHRIALAFELFDHSRHVHGIPENDGIGDEVETTGLMDELFPSFATQTGMTNEWLSESLGLVSIRALWISLHYPT